MLYKFYFQPILGHWPSYRYWKKMGLNFLDFHSHLSFKDFNIVLTFKAHTQVSAALRPSVTPLNQRIFDTNLTIFSTKSVPEYGTERYTKGLQNFLCIFFLAHRTGQSHHNLYDLCTLSSFGWEEVLETLTILLLWEMYVLHMNAIVLDLFSMVLLIYMHFRGDVVDNLCF